MSEFARLAQIAPILMFGLMAGFFYAFSVCVMAGLDRLAPAAAIGAMQAINEAVRNPVFFVTFFLTPLVAFGAAALAYQAGEPRQAAWMALAALVYILLAALPTAIINVPMNEALADVEPDNVDAAAVWTAYADRWTAWNTVRTVTSTLAMAAAVYPFLESN
ncbi:DUF1772 domain-containing protein [Roseitalea porphyridii]|nr:anthrone oxygenase family protein [Roseitalea porphyridii]